MKYKILKLALPVFSLLLTSCNEKEIAKNSVFNFLTPSNEIIEIPSFKEQPKTYLYHDYFYYYNYDYNFDEGYKLISQIINVSTLYDMPRMDGFSKKGISYIYNDKTYMNFCIEESMIYSEYFDDSYALYIDGSFTKNDGNYFYCVYQNKYLYEKIINYFDNCAKVASSQKLTWYELTHD